jgi:aldose 1-epimerase
VKISRSVIGTTKGHPFQGPTSVHSYTLDTGKPLAVTVWTFGAALVEVVVPDRTGLTANVAIRLPALASYEDRRRNPYIGGVLGRYCRSVSGGRFWLDGIEHRLDRNDGRHHVHGGTIGLDRFVWASEAARDGDSLAARLSIERPDGDQGYPGALSAEVTFRARAGGHLELDYRATTTASTIVGLTSHAFWNMAGGGVVDGHRLAVNASRIVRLDDELIPVPGAPASVTDSNLDYRFPRPLGCARLDNFFVLDDPDWAAVLHDPRSGRVMRVVTDQPGLAVYSGDGLPTRRTGLCVQASAWPDAPNRPDFPSCRLDPGEVYRHRTVHSFTCDDRL